MQERSALETHLAAAELTVNAGRARVGVLARNQVQGQRCTDASCCVVFVLSLLATVALGALGAKHGNTEVLVRFSSGRDFKGRLCGIDDGVQNFNLTYFTFHMGHEPIAPGNWTRQTRSELRAVCTTKCPQPWTWDVGKPVNVREAALCPPDMSPDWCTWYGASSKRLANYCVDPSAFEVGEEWGQWLQDLHASAWILAAVPLISLVVGFAFLGFVHRCGGLFIWVGLVVTALLPAAVGFLFFESAQADGQQGSFLASELRNYNPKERKEIAYALWALAAVIVILGCCLARTIMSVVDVLRATSQFLTDVPSQMLQPFLMGIVQLICVGVWLVIFVAVASIGVDEGEQSACLSVGDIYCLKWDSHTQNYGLAFLVVELYWLLNFLHALSHFGTAYAVNQWYSASEDPLTGRKAPSGGGHTFCDCRLSIRGLCRGLARHPGSLAMGAFVIVLCKISRLFLWWAKKDAESVPQNALSRCVRRCTECIADCVTRFIEFVSEHAYVEVAITGTSFMKSAQKAATLTLHHPALFALVGRVACVVRLLGVALVTSGTAYAVSLILLWWHPVSLVSVKAPVLAASIGAFAVGEVMMHPFSAAARASLHCLCYDRDHLNAPQGILRLVEEHSVAEEPHRGCCCCC